ncbi:MAG: large subunit ribosomal protein L3 [Parcubacteria group bacterium Licking1014_17]|nr:MAG: large subunit ribosomal protein L3 [Parcubacteria group bacterium Licking1014_17]
MTRVFKENGTVVPVTLIKAGPAVITQIRTRENDGYEAVQVGFEPARKIKKPQRGHLKNMEAVKHLREFRIEKGDAKVGDAVTVSQFKPGDFVKISGVTKGKGFQGVVKRHGFHGMPASHGHKSVKRHGGSIGQRFPQHTLKGMRMPGRMGGVRATIRGLEVVMIDTDKNILAVKGAVPGRNGALLEVIKI